MGGWIRLWRDVLDSQLWSSSDATFRVAIYLLLSVNHEPAWFKGVRVERGQCIRALRTVAQECHLSLKAVRYAMATLEKLEGEDGTPFVLVDHPFGAQGSSRFTVCKYEHYQAVTGAPVGPPSKRGTPRAHASQPEGHTEGTEQEEEEVSNTREDTCVIGPGELALGVPAPPAKPGKKRFEYPPAFDAFWQAYHPERRLDKLSAFKAWEKAVKNLGVEPAVIEEGARRYTAWCQAEGKAAQYVKHPSVWLNAGGWDSEYKVDRRGQPAVPRFTFQGGTQGHERKE